MSFKRALDYNYELYSTTYDEISFTYRLLSIKEFNYFSKILAGGVMPPFFIYEEIFNHCYVESAERLHKNTPVGLLVTTGHLIYQLSGGKEPQDFLIEIAEERKAAPPDSIYEHMKSVIFTAFSTLTPKDIESLTEKQFIKYFVSAENKLRKTLQGYQVMDLKKIYEEIYEKDKEDTKEVKSEVVHNVQQMEQEAGYWEVQEAERKFIEEEKARLRKEHLEALDRRG